MATDSQVSSDRTGAQESPASPNLNPELVNPEPAAGTVAPIWLQRLALFTLVLFCVYLGVLVLILPWWPQVWDRNMFIESHPALAAVLHNGAMRGLISGVGLLDIWIGISEAVHYRDHRA
jgi:hypothetical protein